eukprot:scaffold360_cov374-Pavlova_lutheri.AAC.25
MSIWLVGDFLINGVEGMVNDKCTSWSKVQAIATACGPYLFNCPAINLVTQRVHQSPKWAIIARGYRGHLYEEAGLKELARQE